MFTSLGLTLSALDRGAGAPVVCVHGTFGAGLHWAPFARHVGSDLRVVAPDLFGEGASPLAPQGWHPFDADVVLVQDVLDQIDAPVHLVGHSFGATVALAAALESPAQVATLTLLEPNGIGDARRGAGDPGVFGPFRDAMTRSRARLLDGDPEGAAGAIVDMAQGEGMWGTLGPERRAFFARTVPKYARLWEETLARAPRICDAAAIHRPMLVVAGTLGPLHGRWTAARIAEAAPDARHVTLAGAGHMAHVTHPSLLAEAFRGLLPRPPGVYALSTT